MRPQAGGKFTQGAENVDRSLVIGNILEAERGGEVGRARTQQYVAEVAFAGYHESVHHRLIFRFPTITTGKQDRAGTMCLPGAIGLAIAIAVAAPAMIVHFEMEGGGRLEIGFDGERFALWFSRQPSAEHKRTRPQVQRDARTAQTAGGNLQAGAQAGRSTPAHGDDAAAPGETQTIDNF